MTWKQVFKKALGELSSSILYIGRSDTRLRNVVGGFALWWKLRRKINVPQESVTSPNQNEILLDLSAFSEYDIEICSKMGFAYTRWLLHGLLGWGKKASLELCNWAVLLRWLFLSSPRRWNKCGLLSVSSWTNCSERRSSRRWKAPTLTSAPSASPRSIWVKR